MSRSGTIAILLVTLAALAARTQPSSPGFNAADYWRMPLAAQGDAPSGWTPLERSLAPEDCGACHADQFQHWRRSRHAAAFSPGLVGQLLNVDAPSGAACMTCHAPLAEQREAFEAARTAGAAHIRERQGLAAAGNACGGCHLRQHQRFGPPQRGSGGTGPSLSNAPHGGVFRTPFFESSEFCSPCHQHPPETALNGKPIENTYVEWQASPQARQGRTCQSCHMPDRQHQWRGIHDPAMVAAGLTARTSAGPAGARLEITSTGIGHAFPTYAVPTVTLHAVALDQNGMPQPQTLRSRLIARRIQYSGDPWVELSDTRLMPGQSAAIEIAWEAAGRARVWLEVVPDHFYQTEVYPSLLKNLPRNSDAARLIARARAEAAANRFNLFDTELHRP